MESAARFQIPSILERYELKPSDFEIEPIGSGHIHFTFKVKGSKSFVLQRVNKNVFKEPEIIAANIQAAANHLKNHFPEFLFLTPIVSADGKQMVYDTEGYPWRLFPYFQNTFTIDKVENADQARSAAAEFANLTRKLAGIDVSVFRETIPRFHDLSWRNEQFMDSLANAKDERLSRAQSAIENAKYFGYLVEQFKELTSSEKLRRRITHNDTKINNVLFNSETGRTVCAIDLDTLMPGYFIYDIGDMFRTFVSPVDEEEKDISKVGVRKEIYDAVVDGYLATMGDELSADEIQSIPFSGMMMTYIMALRMLTDFLNGDVYYHTTYPGQNLVRANNQFALLKKLAELK